MEKVSIERITPGMKSAVAVFDSNGSLIVDGGGVIDQEIVNQLRKEGFPGIYVCESNLFDIAFPFIVMMEKRVQMIQYLKKLEVYPTPEAITLLKDDYILKLINNLKGKNEIEVVPPEIRPKSVSHLMSKVNVCILSLLTAIRLKCPDEELETMAMEILLKNSFSKNTLSALTREIIQVVNDFDYMVSGQDFKVNLPTFHALDKIKKAINLKYRPEIVEAFLQIMAPFPLGSKVKLNDGAIGVVLDINTASINEPIVRIVTDQKRVSETEIDLMKHKECSILDVIN